MGIIKRNFANNILSSGTFDATKLTGDIPAGNLSANAPAFDDNKVVNDLATLGLRVHTQNNLNASNTNSQFVDVFNDASGIDTTTNVSRNASEYVSSVSGTALPTGTVFYLKSDQANGSTTFTDSSSSNLAMVAQGNTQHSSTQAKFGSTSIYYDGTDDWIFGQEAATEFDFGTGEFRIECYINLPNGVNGEHRTIWCQGGYGRSADYAGTSIIVNTGGALALLSSTNQTGTSIGSWAVTLYTQDLTWTAGTWYHLCFTRGSDGTIRIFRDGTEQSYDNTTGQTGSTNLAEGDYYWRLNSSTDGASNTRGECYIDNLVIAKGTGSGITSNFTPVNSQYGQTFSATGDFTSTTITAPSSVSSMGAVITYQDNAGTNALNTDIVLQLSADNGSNYTTATLEALPDFSSGIKMAKVNDLAIGTPGTQLKYKISFANQSDGVKEARIRGVSLNY